MARRSTIDPRRPATRFRPTWRLPVTSPAHTDKKLGDVEITSLGFFRLTIAGWERIENHG